MHVQALSTWIASDGCEVCCYAEWDSAVNSGTLEPWLHKVGDCEMPASAPFYLTFDTRITCSSGSCRTTRRVRHGITLSMTSTSSTQRVWERVEENRVWYVACDATPHDKEGKLLPGAAYVIDPNGRLVACTPKDTPGEGMVVATIEKKAEAKPK